MTAFRCRTHPDYPTDARGRGCLLCQWEAGQQQPSRRQRRAARMRRQQGHGGPGGDAA